MNDFITALAFLTRLPIKGGDKLDNSIWTFPIVGAVIGLIASAVYYVLNLIFPQWAAISFGIVTMVLITGGIHLDGYLDTCDGVFSGRERDRMLEIMKDSRIGAMGFIWGAFYIVLYLGFWLELSNIFHGFILVPTLGRWGMGLAIILFPYGREKGLGRIFNPGQRRMSDLIKISVFPAVIIIFLYGLKGSFLLIVPLFIYFIAGYLKGILGGLTGDIYGFINQVTELLVLILLFLISSGVLPWI